MTSVGVAVQWGRLTWVPRHPSIMWVSSLAANMGTREHSRWDTMANAKPGGGRENPRSFRSSPSKRLYKQLMLCVRVVRIWKGSKLNELAKPKKKTKKLNNARTKET